MPLANVDAGFPPTLLVHGKADTDVPHEQSVLMAEALAAADVEHRLISVEGAEHGLDGAPQTTIDDAERAAASFLQTKLGGHG
jgi:dipeptidyl aminopeptidase/acylaminoacyl peptidase